MLLLSRLIRLWLLLALCCVSSLTSAAPQVAFTVGFPKPWTHYLDVEMRVSGLATGKTTDIVLPVWTPGSYLVREYARNVQEFSAVNAEEKPLPWRKINKNTWRIEKGTATVFTARYRVYANVLAVQQAEVTDEHAFWNNAAVLMHLSGQLAVPATLTVVPPNGWKVATGLPAAPGSPYTFRSENFDILYDSPMLAGDFVELTFVASDKPHRIVISGKGNYDPERLTADVKKIVETAGNLMGGLPYNSYTFLLMLRPGGGGLEHLNSTALIFSPYAFNTPDGYRSFLTLVAHEFFHLWNIKRIRPDTLGPFDYSSENYTRLLWVAEGITSYYEDVLVRRADLMSPDEFIRSLSGAIGTVERTPGRKILSLEDASFDAWIKYYRTDENSLNSQISYYTKGSVVGMLLDLTLRQRTNGTKSLDDVLRTLNRDFAQQNRNYTPTDFQKVCETVAGGSLEPFFADFVRGTKELDYDPILATVGLRLQRTASDKENAYFGARLTADSLGVRIAAVPSDTPAYEQGFSAGDILVAVDTVRIASVEFLNDRLREKKPGQTVTLTFFRNDTLRTREVTLGGQAPPIYRLAPMENPTEAQRQQLKAWLSP